MKYWEEKAVIITLVLAVFTSSHIVFFDLVGLRIEFQALLSLFISISIWVLFKKNFEHLNVRDTYVLFLLIVTLFISELAFRGRPEKLLGYVLATVIVFIVFSSNRKLILKSIDCINITNLTFALIAIIGLVLSLYSQSVYDAILLKWEYYNDDFPSGNNILSLFGHADGYNKIFGTKYLRISGHLLQKSLVSSYILLPLSLGLIFSKIRPINILVLLIFSLISLGATTIITFLFGILIYVLRNYLHKALLLFIPFFFLSFILITTVYFFYDFYDPNNIKEVMQSSFAMSDDINPLINRFISGLARLMLIAFQAIEFFNVFPFPAKEQILNTTFGSNILTNGLRGGLPALLLSIFLYFKLYSLIASELVDKNNENKLRKFGLALLYSLTFQSMVFSDYGFSTFYGFMMFAIIFLLFKKK